MSSNQLSDQPADPRAALLEEIDRLFDLNPDRAALRQERLLSLADECCGEAFAEMAERAGRLVDAYLDAPSKRTGRAALNQYFSAVRNTARQLVAGGDLPDTVLQSDETKDSRSFRALTPLDQTAPAEWVRIMQDTPVPHTLSVAVEAYRNRASALCSILEIMFRVLLRIDRQAAFSWQKDLLHRFEQGTDPELARDLLRAWQTAFPLPPSIIEVVLSWSTDRALLREWPAVVQQADRLLRHIALAHLRSQGMSKNSHLRRLREIAMARGNVYNDLRRWLEVAMLSLGRTVAFFLQLAGPGEQSARSGAADADWSRNAVTLELESLEALYPNLLILADILDRSPDGAARFAYALFGFTGEGRCRWHDQLVQHSRDIIRRMFLRDVRQRRSVVPTIRRLCFGDARLALQLQGYLNLSTGQFNSLEDRMAAIDELAPYYASYREQELMSQEITRRYRRLMRVLHSDNLGHILPPEPAARFSASPVIRNMASVAASARTFLNRRRALHSPLEDVLAAEFEFAHLLRRQRAGILRDMTLPTFS